MAEETRIYTKVFFALTNTWSDTYSFRHIVHAGLPDAERQLAEENAHWFSEFLDGPASEGFFLDKGKFLEVSGGRRAIAERLTEQAMNAFRGSVDAASLVFMHSGLDGAAHDLCRVTAMVAPERWHTFIDNRRERLAAIRTKGYDVVVKEHLDGFVEALSLESLMKKTDRLFQVCRPGQGYSRKGYTFNRERLTELDILRHDIIHGDRPRAPIVDIEDRINFLLETGLFLFGMVNYCFNVKIDPTMHDDLASLRRRK